jgi:hypothetical protein
VAERTVFLVYGYDYYEYPYNPIKAFADESAAKALLAEISAYQDGRPQYPSGDATDEEYEAFNESYERWCGSHPAKHAYGHDGFDVMPLELEDPTHDA